MHNQFKTQKFKHLMLAMGPRDLNSAPYSPVHCSSHSMTSFQSSELTELPVVENGQLFAQRAHSARYAPYGVPVVTGTLLERCQNYWNNGSFVANRSALRGSNTSGFGPRGTLVCLFVLVQTKLSWRTLFITWYLGQRLGFKVQSRPVVR